MLARPVLPGKPFSLRASSFARRSVLFALFLVFLPLAISAWDIQIPVLQHNNSLVQAVKNRVTTTIKQSIRQACLGCGIPDGFWSLAPYCPGWSGTASEAYAAPVQEAIITSPRSEVQSLFSADQPGLPSTVSLKILDANLWGLPYPFANHQEVRLDNFIALARDYSPDLILLQEIWMPPWIEKLHRALPEYWLVHPPDGLYLPTGLVILSRVKPLNAGFAQFPITPDHSLLELLANKGWLKITVKFQRQIFDIVTTHLYASITPKEREIADAQARLLNASVANASVPVILAGDLNTRPEPLHSLLASTWGWEGNLASPTTVRGDKKIDYVFLHLPPDFVGTSSTSALREPVVSDHLPLIASITVKNLHGG